MKKPNKPFPPRKYEYQETEKFNTIYHHDTSIEDDNMSLQDIINLIPVGINPKDVFFKINHSSYGVEIFFFYNQTIPANPEGFKLAQEKYKQNLLKYEEDLKKYQEYEKQQRKTKLLKQLEELEK